MRSREDLITIEEQDLPVVRPASSFTADVEAEPLAALNQLVGVEEVKEELRTLLNLLRVQKLRHD